MTPKDLDSNQPHIDSFEQSATTERILTSQDSDVGRREFLGITAASLLIARSVNGAAKPDTRNGIPYRTLGRTGEKVSVVITGCDSLPILQQALSAARNFQPMDSSEVAALLARTAKAAATGQFELYKTTHHFDGTVQSPQWLG
jgi:hypothetical protein